MRTFTKLFKNKDVLTEMLRMRAEGYSYPYLAEYFKCHYSSIITQCQKNGVEANKEKIITRYGRIWKKHNERIKRIIIKSPMKIEPKTEPVKIRKPREIYNQGKTYTEYIRESESRKFIRDEKGSIIKIVLTPPMGGKWRSGS